jgi:hypothetical protein
MRKEKTCAAKSLVLRICSVACLTNACKTDWMSCACKKLGLQRLEISSTIYNQLTKKKLLNNIIHD